MPVMLEPTEVMAAILENPTDMDHVRSLTSEQVEYVSLNYDNPDLKKLMPWCGTQYGPESIVKTFVDVGNFWHKESLDVEALFGADENVAIFGRFTYRSTALGKQVTTPFAIFAKVINGKCIYMQFMEDTFATSASFRSGGEWTFRSNPNGEEVRV
jgi:uncharacterized protein